MKLEVFTSVKEPGDHICIEKYLMAVFAKNHTKTEKTVSYQIFHFSLEQKLSQRKARLEAIRSQQELAKQQRKELTEKELRQMQEKLVSA